MLFLRVSGASLAMCTLLVLCVSGELSITQINTDTLENWPVRGVATYEYGGNDPRVFFFQCTTDSNDGIGLFFTRKDMATIPHTQLSITNGVQIEVNPPTTSDTGVYICHDTATNEEVQFLLTEADPATLAAVDSLTHYVGDTVVIDMYASTLTPLTDDIISWEFNDTLITNGTFSNSKTTLTIENVQLSDAGVYRIAVAIGGLGNSIASSYSNTTLHILGEPVYSFSEEQYSVNEGYRFVAVASVSANPDVMNNDTVWRKDNTVLSQTSNIQCNATTLTIMSASRDDAGNYSITGTNEIGMGSASFDLIVFSVTSTATTSVSTATTSVTSTSSSSTSSTDPTETVDATAAKGLSDGKIGGIVVGATIGAFLIAVVVIVIVAVVVIFIFKKNEKA